MNTKESYSSKRNKWFRFIPLALFLMGCLFVIGSCDKDDNNTLASDKVVIAFGVDAGEGNLVAKVRTLDSKEGREIISPAEVKKGSTVVFTASHSKGWQIEYWKVNGVRIRSVNPEQEFTADKHLDIRVAFKPYAITPLTEHE